MDNKTKTLYNHYVLMAVLAIGGSFLVNGWEFTLRVGILILGYHYYMMAFSTKTLND